MFKHKIIENQEDFANLQPIWDEYFRGLSHPPIFLSYAWQSAWWKSFSPEAKPFIILIYKQEQLCAIAPFMINRGPFKKVQFMGQPAADYLDFLILPEERKNCLRHLWEVLRENSASWDYLDLCYIRSDSPNLFFLKSLLDNKKYLTSLNLVDKSLAIDLKKFNNFNEFLDSLGSHRKKKIRYDLKRLQQLKGFRFEALRDRLEADLWLQAFFKFYLAKWGARKIKHLAENSFSPKINFYRNLIATSSIHGQIEMASLKVGEEIVAMHFGYSSDGCYYYYTPAYNQKFSKFSPGSILVYLLIEQAFNQGFEKFDLLRGAEEYKYHWTQNEIPLYHFFMANGTLRGKLVGWYKTLKTAVYSQPRLRSVVNKVLHAYRRGNA